MTAQPVPLVPGPTDYYPAIPGPRNALLDMLRRTRSIYTEFYDPDGLRFGMPTYPYRSAPAGWLTRRQLRAKDLRPGRPAAGRAGPVEAPRQAAPGQPVPRIAGAAGAADDAGEVRGAGGRAGRPVHVPEVRPGHAVLHPGVGRLVQRL